MLQIRKREVPSELAAEALVLAWRADGVKLNPPAGSIAIDKLAKVLGSAKPSDLSAFYSLANGMVDYECDKYLVSFWSIDRILREQATGTPNEVWFADVLICSWGFFYRPLQAGNPIIGSDGVPDMALPGFGAFLDFYVNDPEQLGLSVL